MNYLRPTKWSTLNVFTLSYNPTHSDKCVPTFVPGSKWPNLCSAHLNAWIPLWNSHFSPSLLNCVAQFCAVVKQWNSGQSLSPNKSIANAKEEQHLPLSQCSIIQAMLDSFGIWHLTPLFTWKCLQRDRSHPSYYYYYLQLLIFIKLWRCWEKLFSS